MVAMSLSDGEIATILGHNRSVVRKYYSAELNNGPPEANYRVAQSLFKMATDPNRPNVIASDLLAEDPRPLAGGRHRRTGRQEGSERPDRPRCGARHRMGKPAQAPARAALDGQPLTDPGSPAKPARVRKPAATIARRGGVALVPVAPYNPTAEELAVWSTARVDWRERILGGKSLLPALPLRRALAQRAVAIFDRLCLPDVLGQPLLGDVGGEWQREIVAALAGSWDPRLRHRWIRELFLLVPKKNNKTTGGAAVMVVMLLMNERPRAEFLFIAPTHEIADLAFAQAVGMIEADKVLFAKCRIQYHMKRIVYVPTGAFLKVKSFDPKVVTGSKPCGVLLDELHVIAQAPEADRVIGQLRGGLISQAEGFLFTITTHSERPPAGVFLSELTKARAVRDGTLRAPILPILYEFPEGVDWRDARNWHMVTPNNGRSVQVERLRSDYEAAMAAGEAELRRWASQARLDVQIGTVMLTDHWAGASFWDSCAQPGMDLQDLLTRCDCSTIGIDAGGPEDWLGLCVLGREAGTRRWLAWTRAWVHEKAVDRYKGEAQRWSTFAGAGDLVVVPQLGPDVEAMSAIVARVYDTGLLFRVGLDPAGSAKVCTRPSRSTRACRRPCL